MLRFFDAAFLVALYRIFEHELAIRHFFQQHAAIPMRASTLRHHAFIATVMVLAVRCLQAQQPPNLHLGDVDDDGVITVRDIALVVEHVKGSTPLDVHHAVLADVTKDGAVNQADVDELIKEVLETPQPGKSPVFHRALHLTGGGRGGCIGEPQDHRAFHRPTRPQRLA